MMGTRVRRLFAAAVAALLLSFATASGPARADGDPASDYLIGNQVFLSASGGTPSVSQRELVASVAEANRTGLTIRVAVIPSQYDLGSITELWGKPALYARFLGLELGLRAGQRLLVVMPDGFGLYWPGHTPAAADRALGSVGPGDVYRAAQTAVTRLAAASGVRLAVPPSPASGRTQPATTHHAGGGLAAAAIAGIVGGTLLAVGLVVLVFHRRRGRPATVRATPAGRPRWGVLIPGVAGLLVVACLVPIVLLLGLRHQSTAATTNPASIVTPPAISWPPGTRPAPDFALRDQYGRPVSISGLRGRVVLLTFTDPLCRNLCPIEAHLLNYVVGQMPAARRPAIVAVSVDVAADSRADLLQDERRWELVPEWRWAVASPAALAAVWRRYAIGVSVVTKRLAGVTLRYITHTEAAYVIDATGHERALFVWPYLPQDLEHTLDHLG